jgi:hypothetical protein
MRRAATPRATINTRSKQQQMLPRQLLLLLLLLALLALAGVTSPAAAAAAAAAGIDYVLYTPSTGSKPTAAAATAKDERFGTAQVPLLR